MCRAQGVVSGMRVRLSEWVRKSGFIGGLPRHPMLGWNSVGLRWGKVGRDRRNKILQ